MRSTTRQRLPSLRRFGALALLWAASLVVPARVGAVQIFIQQAFVHRNNSNCIAENRNGVVRFRCPQMPVINPAFFPSGPPAGVAAGVASQSPCENPTNAGDVCRVATITSGFGNISNDPEIQFDRKQDADACKTAFNVAGKALGGANGNGPFPPGTMYTNMCNTDVFLCGAVGYGTADTSSDLAVDNISFELFKFQDGSNPLDPGSTPPLRTFFIDAPGALPGNGASPGGNLNAWMCGKDTTGTATVGTNQNPTSDACSALGPFCVLWDGSVNIQGQFGKTNGVYGFRMATQTNQTGASGNVQITAVRAYPSGATFDANPACGVAGCPVTQKPITVDVTNVHVIRSSPSLVGTITPVPTEPYNLFYRLSKDATMFITIAGVNSNGILTPIRSILPGGQTRVGEGTPNGSLSNGDSWNGRMDNGDFAPPGNYVAVFQAASSDQFGQDLSAATTLQIGLDPLQITDIRVQPLVEGSTSLAVLDYVLTEPSTVYIDVYPPGTQFCGLGVNVNAAPDVAASATDPTIAAKDFQPKLGDCTGGGSVAPLIKHITEVKQARQRVVNFWDGRAVDGTVMADGDYVFVMYASMPSQNGFGFGAGGPASPDKRIWTSQAKSGFLPVVRGFVAISQVTPATSVMGSSPAVAGLNPFLFRYSLSRDAIVTLKIFDSTGVNLIKTVVNGLSRPGLFGNVDRWDDGKDDNGVMVDSGTYMAELTAYDPLQPSKVSRTTALFPVNLLRITDVFTTPLLNGASDLLTVSYQLSQPMNVYLNIYPPGTVVKNTLTTWPPCAPTFPTPVPCASITDPVGVSQYPIVQIHGYRSGRLKITEQWDGRDNNGLIVPDGQYVFVLSAQSTATARVGVSMFPPDHTLGTLTVQRGQILFPTFAVNPDVPTLFNSSNTITLHPFTVQYSLTRQSSVTIQVLNTNIPPQIIRTVIAGEVRQNGILLQDIWDGRDDKGNFPPQGFYIVRALATDVAAQLSSGSTAQVTISYDPIRIYDVAVSPVKLDTPGSTIFYQVSEPMKVGIKIYRPGTFFDPQGNPSPPEAQSLVKRIVGVRAARVQIEDTWDGTDLRLTPVPDGGYKFKIVGSTDVKAIDDVTGNILNASALSLDRPVDEIPVTRGASLDPQGDFERNSFVYPNPVTTANATFQLYMPFQGHLRMRLHTISGELVFDKDFGEVPPSFSSGGPLIFPWNRSNQAGRPLARGIYFMVLRAEETLGGKTVLQTVKKLLIP